MLEAQVFLFSARAMRVYPTPKLKPVHAILVARRALYLLVVSFR